MSNMSKIVQHLYQSDFVICALAKHIRATESAVDCPGLYADGNDLPIGAIGLAGAAVCSLWVYGHCLSCF